MKAQCSYFQQKNTKRGLALSTTMAISIVLAILVALLVSMATLNITTTQETVYQREAYIQAKSAIAFVESYYNVHSDQIPGKGGTYGEAVMVFNSNSIADGAKAYITKTDASTFAPGLDETAVQELKDNAADTYVEIVNTGRTLVATAFCKYGENDAYELSKEFDLHDAGTSRGNPFTGNIIYEPTSDTRYLRIHVRTSEAFYNEPYIYVWGATMNASDSPTATGKSSLVNKMSGNVDYPAIKFSGEWDPDDGPTGAMEYEGNGWYVYEIEISTRTSIQYVNAIVTRKDAVRTNADGSFNTNAQSWEFFGIPVPEETGEANGADVYITLNQKELLDAVNTYGASTVDDLTRWFESTYGGDVDDFAQFSGKWYTVYTKKDTATVHYRKAGVYDDSEGVGGFTYEGYGWWRDTSNNLNDSVDIGGNTYHYYEGDTISQNAYGKEVVKELFICEDSSGNVATFGTEADANDWFVRVAGDVDAEDYVTINVKANEQPVGSAVTTTIEYTSEVITGATPPSPGTIISSDSDTATTDTDSELASTDVSYSADEDNEEDDEPQVLPLKNSSTDKLSIQNTAATLADVQESGSAGDYLVTGTFNNWGLNDEGVHLYENLDVMSPAGGTLYTLTYTGLEPGVTYKFKIVQQVDGHDDVQWDGHSWGNGGSDYTFTVPEVTDATITFDRDSKFIDVSLASGGGVSSGKTYSVIGWLNDWGRLSSTSDHYYENLNDMSDNGDCNFEYTVPTLVDGGQAYTFKIVEKLASEGTLEEHDGWSYAWGGSGGTTDADGNYVLDLSEYAGYKYTVTIKFNENSHQINVDAVRVAVDDSTYYLVGTFNDWANNHQYSDATAYQLTLSGVDSEGNSIYKLDIGRRNPGTEEVKVISSNAELTTPDSEGKTINYEYSWGDADTSGVTYGSDKAAFSYTLTEVSDVVITFTVNAMQNSLSRITYSFTPYDPGHETYTLKPIGFHNNQLVNVNDSSIKTNFTTPWTSVYVTYYTDRAGLQCDEVSMTSGSDIVWAYVPSDATYIYFSNKEMAERGSAGYEFTENIDSSKFATITNPVFFPKTSTTDTNGLLWTTGDNTEYSSYAYTITNFNETAEMVYTGSSQTNYYDVPMVKMLRMLVEEKTGDNSSKFAFSAYCFSTYDTGHSYLGNTIHFNSGNYVDYQGERYYYTNVSASYSYLIIQNTGDSSGISKGGYLLENHFALMSSIYPSSGANKPATNMDNRGGAIFTSDGYYYNGDSSPHSYGGYTPSWYTYKIHASTSYTIKNIKGVTSTSTGIISGNSHPTEVVKANTYYNQPLYIYRDENGDTKVYTYNTDTGKVDTSSTSEVSVYFNKPSSWSSKVYCYAYGIGTSTAEEVFIDSTNADNNYYKFTFDSGEYAYFVFYDYNATCSDGSVIKNSTDKLDTITQKTGVLYLTGEENDAREYAILADGEGANSFSYFLHPKTQALYAFQEARSAYNESKVFATYSYNSSTSEYTGVGSMLSMSTLESQMNSAKNYWENGSGGRWSASGSGSYADLAAAAREFSEAISNARIYIAEEDPADPDDADYIFPEGEYRDDVLSYKKRWVDSLKVKYNSAMSAYSNPGLQNAGSLRSLAAEINTIIAAPETVLAADAVKLIIDDQTDSSGNGHWGKDGINLYNNSTGTWVDVGYTLYDTSQTDYYGYAFKLILPDEYAVLRDGETEPEAGKKFTLMPGCSYIFHTATGKIDMYDETAQTIITTDEIKEGGDDAMWAVHESATIGKEFELYFKYDTKVQGGGQTYVIRAGAYTIDANYANFSTDFTGKTGINLFTAAAKDFFTDPTRYGMNLATSTSYTTWDTSYPDDGTDKDVMCDSISYSGEISAKSATNKKVSFRYNGAKNHDTLVLNQNVVLGAGVVNMAVNNLKLNGYDFTINAKTVVFRTDVEVTTTSGTTYTILHGTYIFNDTSSGTTAKIDLNNSNWTDNYTLVDELNSELMGGKFVASN